MIIIDVIKIICLTVLCIWTTYTDIKHGIIKNKVVVIFSCFALILNIITWSFFERNTVLEQAVNIIIVNIISLTLYIFHVWAGGDCKLLFAVSMLIPFDLYIKHMNFWASLSIMLCLSFALSYIYLIFDSIYCSIKYKKIHNKHQLHLKIKASIIRWIICVIYISLIDTLIFRVKPHIPTLFIIIINICCMLLISVLKPLYNKFIALLSAIAVVTLKFIFNQQIFNIFSFINYLIIIALISLKMFIDEYNYNTISTSQVKPGMILSLATTLQFSNSKVKNLPSQSTENLKSRLTEDEVRAIKRWEKSKYGAPTIQIIRKIPFAIFISLGAILYVILGVLIK